MLPSAFVLMAEFPLTPNRKVDRRALPAPGTASLHAPSDHVAPSTVLEAQLVHIWRAVLGIRTIGVTDNFFDLGGHSLLVVRMFAEIENALGAHLPMATIFEAPTVEQLAAILDREGWTPNWSSLVAIQPGGSRPPFFCVHEYDGNVFYYRDLARRLGDDQPLFGLQARGLDGSTPPQDSIEDMAAHYVREMRSFQPQGPYYLGGSSLGGLVAFEMARQIHAQGQEVALLALFDSFSIGYLRLLSLPMRYRVARHLRGLAKRSVMSRLAYVFARARSRIDPAGWLRGHVEGIRWRMKHRARIRLLRQGRRLPPDLLDLHMRTTLTQAQARYEPEAYAGKVTFFQAEDRPRQYYHDPRLDRRALAASGFLVGDDDDPAWDEISRLGWGTLAAGGLELHRMAGSHGTIIREPYVEAVAARLRACMDAALAGADESPAPGSGAP
jgi:thioesterase domain-containing protein/acyl carrier protein